MKRSKKPRNFRPDLFAASLEDRVVLTAHGLGDSPIPDAILAAYTHQFRAEYATLKTDLNQAANTVLAGGNGTTPTTATRSAYDAQVNQDIAAVQTDFTNILALSPLAKQKFTPDLQTSLTGTAATSLQSKLAALPADTGAPLTAFIDQATAEIVAEQEKTLADYAIFVSESNPLRRNLENTHVNAVDAVNQSYINQLNSLFSTAETGYTSAVTVTLLASTDPTAIASHRAAFDAQVKTLVDSMNSSYADMIFLSSATSPTLTTAVNNRLVGSTNSLLTQLNALSTPTDLSGTTASAFQTSATAAFTSANSDITKLVNQFFTGKSLNSVFPF